VQYRELLFSQRAIQLLRRHTGAKTTLLEHRGLKLGPVEWHGLLNEQPVEIEAA